MATDKPEYTMPDGKKFTDFKQYQAALDKLYPDTVPITDQNISNYDGAALISRFTSLEGQRRGGNGPHEWANTNWGREWAAAYKELARRGLADPSVLVNKDLNDAQKKTLNDALELFGLITQEHPDYTKAA